LCDCATDIEGNAACAKFGTPDAFCPSRPDRLGRECAQNADCGDGFVCIKATKPDCFNCGTIGGTSCEPVCA
jgi:Cys-rich repeat protein